MAQIPSAAVVNPAWRTKELSGSLPALRNLPGSLRFPSEEGSKANNAVL